MEIEYAFKFSGEDNTVQAAAQPWMKPELPDAAAFQNSLVDLTKTLAPLKATSLRSQRPSMYHDTQEACTLVDRAEDKEEVVLLVPAIIVDKKVNCSGTVL